MPTDANWRPLFRAEGTATFSKHPALLGGRCRSCGLVFFPMQRFGCEGCGSLDLEEREIAGRGRLINSAKVHVHAGPGRTAPFTVGSVITDEGAIVRVLLDPVSADELRPGDAVTALLVPETREGMGPYDLRFGKEI